MGIPELFGKAFTPENYSKAFNEVSAGYGLWDVQERVIATLPRASLDNLGEHSITT